jgi:hypothetical protein
VSCQRLQGCPQIRREAHSTSSVTSIETSICILRPPACEGVSAVVLLTGGRGGSATSDCVKSGIGASAGGCTDLSMVERRPPGWGGCIKMGAFFPILEHEFTAETKFINYCIDLKY